MLRKLMSKMMIITVASTMILTGCSSQSLDERVNNYDDRYYESAAFICNIFEGDIQFLSDYNESEKLELVEKYDNQLNNLQNELEMELEDYDKETTEYKMFKSLRESVLQMDAAYGMINTLIVSEEMRKSENDFVNGLSLANYIDTADKNYEAFNQYVKELEIEIENPKEDLYNPMDEVRNNLSNLGSNITIPNECAKCGVTIAQYQNLCDHCLNYANCDDCGREKPINEMTLTGKTYHCGCAQDYFNCAYCGKLAPLSDCVGSDYCSDYCLDQSRMSVCANCGKATDEMAEFNYQDYCYNCYNSIMESMYGPASVPEE